MHLEQQPPFLICVPIRHSKAWAGLAARQIEALLDRLGNPACSAMRDALDASGVIHFLSLSVVWDEQSKDPPILVADVAGDGTPATVIAALVEHAGAQLMTVFQAAAGVNSLEALRKLLLRRWVKPVASSWPLWPHRATGLPFQGTPGLTVKRVREDEQLALQALTAVLSHSPHRPSTALSYLSAAQTNAGIVPASREPFEYSEDAPSLSKARFYAKAWAIFSLFAIDWSFIFVFLLVSFSINFHEILSSLNPLPHRPEQIWRNKYRVLLFSAVIIGTIMRCMAQIPGIRTSDSKKNFNRAFKTAFYFLLFFLTVEALAPRWFLGLFKAASHIDLRDWLTWIRNDSLLPFVWWMALALSAGSVILFVAAVATILLWLLRRAEKRDRPRDADPDIRLLAEIIRREDLAPHRQNHMIAVSTISPGLFRRFVALPAALYAASLTVRSGMFRTGFLSGIGTIHFLQWARLPRTRKLVFTANYDGSWQSYLEDAITLLPSGATGIWSNAVGFPKTSWLFFQGSADGDRFKRWVRRQMIPTRFWYSAYPHLTTTDIRRNAAVRLGLEAKSITASQADTWLKLFGSEPRPVSDLETDHIQGVALSGYRTLCEGALLPISFSLNQAACRAWLAGVSSGIHFGEGRQTESAMGVALSARGLERLGPGATYPMAAGFSAAFTMGMANEARANVLGDVGQNAPGKWRWGGPQNPADAVLLIYAKDQSTLWKILRAERLRCVQAGLRPLPEINLRRWPPARDPTTNLPVPIIEPFGFVDGISQPRIGGLRSSRGRLAGDVLDPGEFILGYQDGRQMFPPTPQVLARHDALDLLPDLPPEFPGQPGEKPVRDLGRNGTYLVIRQLKQDVVGYHNYVKAAASALGEPPDRVAAKMVGRWPNGAPLVLFPERQPASYDPIRNDESFLFRRDDPQGIACPIGAHIRRANPRDQFDRDNTTQMSITNRHRIIRRSRAYVDGCDSGANPQGLLFMCLNADIERQFEFLQQTWIGSSSFDCLRNESDPLTALNRKGGNYTIPTLTGPKQMTGMPSFVSVVGGGYFFLPGRQALKFLSA